jgi:hypothetical protein
VIVRVPTGRTPVETSHVPLMSVQFPSAVEPSERLTVPVIPVVVGEVTLTRKVAVWRYWDGVVSAVTVVVLDAWPTTKLSADEVLAVLLSSPPYVATTLRIPAGRALVVTVQEPPLSEQVPSEVEPSERLIVPVGVGPALETETVKVTDSPYVDDVGDPTTVVVEVALTDWVIAADVLAA